MALVIDKGLISEEPSTDLPTIDPWFASHSTINWPGLTLTRRWDNSANHAYGLKLKHQRQQHRPRELYSDPANSAQPLQTLRSRCRNPASHERRAEA